MQRTPAERISVAAIRGFAGVATAIAVGWILTRAGVPEGRLSTTGTFDGPAPFLSEPKPSDRVKPESEGENRLHEMLSSTVLLDFTPPSRFDTARVSVEYVTAAPVVEIGALASTLDSAFAVTVTLLVALEYSGPRETTT